MVKTNGNCQVIDLTVKPFSESEGMDGLLIVVFGDTGVSSKRTASGKVKTGSASRQGNIYKELEKELASTRERLQTTLEEVETSREDLKSSNEALFDDIKAVLQTLVFKDVQVQTKDGCWYLMRIMPYRTLDNIIGGVVATFTEITGVKRLEASLREREVIQEACRFAASIVETIREPLLIMDAKLRVVSANRSFYRTFHVSPEETKNGFLYELGNRQWDIPELRRLLEDMLPKNHHINNYRIEHDIPKLGHRVILLNARQVIRKCTGAQMILLAIEDITKGNKKS